MMALSSSRRECRPTTAAFRLRSTEDLRRSEKLGDLRMSKNSAHRSGSQNSRLLSPWATRSLSAAAGVWVSDWTSSVMHLTRMESRCRHSSSSRA